MDTGKMSDRQRNFSGNTSQVHLAERFRCLAVGDR